MTIRQNPSSNHQITLCSPTNKPTMMNPGHQLLSLPELDRSGRRHSIESPWMLRKWFAWNVPTPDFQIVIQLDLVPTEVTGWCWCQWWWCSVIFPNSSSMFPATFDDMWTTFTWIHSSDQNKNHRWIFLISWSSQVARLVHFLFAKYPFNKWIQMMCFSAIGFPCIRAIIRTMGILLLKRESSKKHATRRG